MYLEEWLRARVREHLPGGPLEGAVFVAETGGVASGHVILRREAGFGLFSTNYVTPSQRRSGLGDALITHGERWFVERGLTAFATHTATDNGRLRALLKRRGYREVLRRGGMVRLERSAELGAPPDLGGPDSEGPDSEGPDLGGL